MGAGDRHSGGCLCGAVRFSAVVPRWEQDACHCGMCRRWCGGVSLSMDVHDVVLDNPDSVAVHRSSDWAERLFCPRCGTSLGFRLRDGSYQNVQTYAFDPPFDPPLRVEVHVDDKPSGYALAGETRKLTGAEVVALFSRGHQTNG